MWQSTAQAKSQHVMDRNDMFAKKLYNSQICQLGEDK